MRKVSYREVGLLYTLSPLRQPVLRVEPNERFQVETEDAASGQIRKETDVRDRDRVPYGNPVVGPIHVEGARKGDTLQVDIEEVTPSIGQGATYFSAFTYSYLLPSPVHELLGGKLPSKTKVCRIRDGEVLFSEKIHLPYRPMIGTIGTAPALEVENVSSGVGVGPHGGNMDIPEIGPSATVYLPVFHDGALLYVGDAHAVQGDGEISGTGVEMPAEITLRTGLVKEKTIRFPRVRKGSEAMCIATTTPGRGLEDAVKTAFLGLIEWMRDDYALDPFDALMLCSQIGEVRIGNLWAVAAKIDTRYLC